MSERLSISREISVSPEQLYAMVSDITRMGEWSPENEGGEWVGGITTAQSGAKFRSKNRVDKKSWKTVATVVDAEPGRRFSFRVSAGPVKVSEWGYTFDTTPNGCRVTESWTDLRPPWFKPLSRLVSGVSDRATHNRIGIEQTLQRLAAVAESEHPPS